MVRYRVCFVEIPGYHCYCQAERRLIEWGYIARRQQDKHVFEDDVRLASNPELIESAEQKAQSRRAAKLETELQGISAALGNRYSDFSVIGSGGMSRVYRAQHNLLRHFVAIKTLDVSQLSDDRLLKRLRGEALAIKSLTHPNIVSMREFDLDQDIAYLVMDFVDGQTLSDIIGTRMPKERFLQIFRQTCTALAHAHGKGIIHRDIKPSNIMLAKDANPDEQVKLVDFGIAKLDPNTLGEFAQNITSTGEVFGTPLYMSPEQCMGQKLDHRSDIYALGCVMYEAIAGTPPVKGENALETVYKRLNEEPPTFAELGVKCDQEIEKIIRTCLSRDPDKRFQSASELQSALENPAGFAARAGSGNSAMRTAGGGGTAPRLPAASGKHFIASLMGAFFVTLIALFIAAVIRAQIFSQNSYSDTIGGKPAKVASTDPLSGKMAPEEELRAAIQTATKFIKSGNGEDAERTLSALMKDEAKASSLVRPEEFADALLVLGRAHLLQKQYEGARYRFNQALKLNQRRHAPPRDLSECYASLGDTSAEAGDFNRAEGEYRHGLELVRGTRVLADEEAFISDKLAEVLEKQGKLREAEQLFKAVPGLWLNSTGDFEDRAGIAYERLGEFYDKHHRQKDADAAFNRAREIFRKLDSSIFSPPSSAGIPVACRCLSQLES